MPKNIFNNPWGAIDRLIEQMCDVHNCQPAGLYWIIPPGFYDRLSEECRKTNKFYDIDFVLHSDAPNIMLARKTED